MFLFDLMFKKVQEDKPASAFDYTKVLELVLDGAIVTFELARESVGREAKMLSSNPLEYIKALFDKGKLSLDKMGAEQAMMIMVFLPTFQFAEENQLSLDDIFKGTGSKNNADDYKRQIEQNLSALEKEKGKQGLVEKWNKKISFVGESLFAKILGDKTKGELVACFKTDSFFFLRQILSEFVQKDIESARKCALSIGNSEFYKSDA